MAQHGQHDQHGTAFTMQILSKRIKLMKC